LSLSDERARFASLAPAGEPVFAEPWQATAFALVVALHAKSAFTWQEWATALSRELREAEARGEGDGTRYYDHWLAALERILCEKGLSERSAMAARKEDWADAYRRTPHGKPVTL
jgi:nitrile hydratase accessory protein